jgi:hypothetical protein
VVIPYVQDHLVQAQVPAVIVSMVILGLTRLQTIWGSGSSDTESGEIQ